MKFTSEQIATRDFYHNLKEAVKARSCLPERELLTFEEFRILVLIKLSEDFETIFLSTNSKATDEHYRELARKCGLHFTFLCVGNIRGVMVDLLSIADNPKIVLKGLDVGTLLEDVEIGSTEEETLYQELFYTNFPKAKTDWNSTAWSAWILQSDCDAQRSPNHALHAMHLSVMFCNKVITMIEFFSALKQLGILPTEVGCELFTHIEAKALSDEKYGAISVEMLLRKFSLHNPDEPPTSE